METEPPPRVGHESLDRHHHHFPTPITTHAVYTIEQHLGPSHPSYLTVRRASEWTGDPHYSKWLLSLAVFPFHTIPHPLPSDRVTHMPYFPTPQPTFLRTHSQHPEYMCLRWHYQLLGPRSLHAAKILFGAPIIRRVSALHVRVSAGHPISPTYRRRASWSVLGDAFLCSSYAAGISNATMVLVQWAGMSTDTDTGGTDAN